MSRGLCLQCGDVRGVATYAEGDYCFACHNKTYNKSLIPREKESKEPLHEQSELKDIHYIWLLQRGINKDLAQKLGLYYDPNYDRIGFPYYLYSTRLRSIDKNNKAKWLFFGNNRDYMYYLDDLCTSTLVVVEDVISCIRVAKYCDCVALEGTNVNRAPLAEILIGYGRILVWLDGDEAGRLGAERFRKRYKLNHNIKIIKTLKDPKDHTDREIREILDD